MEHYKIVSIQQHPELKGPAAGWFHEKWGIPREAYAGSMEEALKNESPVPRWYVAVAGSMDGPAQGGGSLRPRIIGGLGVIENDFHNRKDLAPNVCAVYVEEGCRGQGIAGELLGYVCSDMAEQGIATLYLITDHAAFYERYGWEFLCMAQGDGEESMSRIYIHWM